MADYTNLTVDDLAEGIDKTRAAIERANKLIERVGGLGAQSPAIWAALLESTERLRTHLHADLDALEKALEAQLQ
jgi:hypothetical protein